MIELDPQRFFSASQKSVLFRLAGGLCDECGAELDVGWHADHVIPHSAGGRTTIENGQALCRSCSLHKGATLNYTDTFEPRPAQAEVLDKVEDNVAKGDRQTVALLAPGSGKELLGQAVACRLYRNGLIDNVVVLAPRINLARQCELNWRKQVVDKPRRHVDEDWEGNFTLFAPGARMEFIEHIENRQPLLPPGTRAHGVATTYQSLVSPVGQLAFQDFAERYHGRFLVVVDEAQFCGDDLTGFGGGTRAGEMVKLLDHHAAHTLIMTGTAERADGAPLVCCNYGAPNAQGVRPLLYDVQATYRDGVREGYLREFVAAVIDSKVTRTDTETDTQSVASLSKDGSNLAQVLRQEDVWKPLADEVCATLRDKKRRHVDYQALISCMQREDVDRIAEYLRRQHADLRVVTARSDQYGVQNTLQNFKDGAADVLVTVRMAYIGYDCKAITVVGILTNYRDKGHLMQLVGRGLRVSDHEPVDDQSCRVIAPDDPRMQEFVEELREQSEQGVKDREIVCGPGGGGPGPATVIVDDAEHAGVRALDVDGEVGHADYTAAMSWARSQGISGDPSNIVKIWRIATKSTAPENPPPAARPKSTVSAKTSKERIKQVLADTSKVIKEAVPRHCEVFPGQDDYGDAVTQLTIEVNKAAGGNADRARKDENFANHRYETAVRMLGEPPEMAS